MSGTEKESIPNIASNIICNKNMNNHLGGHNNITNLDVPVFEYLIQNYNIKSIVDIGCGPGGLKNLSDDYNINWFGIDGDSTVISNSNNTLCHDFSKGSPEINKTFDLSWSIEFLEHVEEKYIKNFMPVFQKSKYAIVTAALPGTPGYHHVNCQPNDYWIKIFSDYGFRFLEGETNLLKSISKMRKSFFKKSGMFFINDISQ